MTASIAETNTELYEKVRDCVAEALALDLDEISPESTLLDELGAESIDLLDILFRIDRATGVKIQSDELASYVQGGIPDEEFGDEDADVITPKGMDQLKKVMPQIAEKDLDGKLSPEDVMSHFTVANLTELVASRA
ncbi:MULTISPECIES: phosphopantetheine-binding protein [Kocuria]|jgi:acyl carrier protein|uniref:Acyl carrier protein n=1 Tax=Kocuria palustris PEL TaxID=1236550 RepID=M2YEP5_9MICC|nr:MULTISPECIES: phosphopantetheine-binding protein [Kocuria]EME37064.1 Acyl carrier protein [Kocuria palustris PEL]KUG53947.1 acyl carrier protein [Kocuria palustris]MBN6752680.1 acyl carrier protein [Kocuria palustris]MBN6757635.1 acyl carrier protein [Kocuria palustris]MBN6762663.1 acyl carrier protein [Kocuria palustris]